MLDIREIEYWISRYENEADKLDQCVILSALYSIRDRLKGEPPTQIAAHSETPPPDETSGLYGDSDFLQAVAGKDLASAWQVIDNLMDTLRVVNPRVYDGVMRKLGRL